MSMPEMVARRRVEDAQAEVQEAEREIRRIEEAAEDESLDQVSCSRCHVQLCKLTTRRCTRA